MSEIDTARLRGLLAKATPGPWEVDTEQSEGEYGSGPNTSTGYDDFLIGAEVVGKWRTILDTVNSDHKLIEEDYDEDYHRAWDVIGEANANLVVAAVNALPGLLDTIESQAARIKELEALAAPRWFYHGDDQSSGGCRFGVNEVIDEDFLWDERTPGAHIVEISTATPLPTIYALVHIFTDSEKDARDSDDEYDFTEFATREAAEEALAASLRPPRRCRHES